MNGLKSVQMTYSLTPLLAKILIMLARHPVVTQQMIQGEDAPAGSGKAAIYRLRRAMGEHSIEILSRNFVGYWLTPENRAAVLETMGEATE